MKTKTNTTESSRFRMGPQANAALVELQKQLTDYAGAFLKTLIHDMNQGDAEEIWAVMADGVTKFEQSGKGLPPFQCVTVGVFYTLRELARWEREGPEGKE